MKQLFLQGGLLFSASVCAQQTPNVIWILADDMRAPTLQLFGEEQCKTPHLNRLAEDCTVFTNAHIMGGVSGAVSMPSRAMLMTGKYMYRLQEEGRILPSEHTTIGEVLRKAGYETFHIGKWHNDKAAFNRCFSAGKDIFFGGMADHWNVPLYSYDPSGQYTSSRRVIEQPGHTNEVKILPGEYMYSGKHSVDIFTDTAIEYVKERAGKEQSFFLSLNYMSPHDPRSTSDEFHAMYNPEEINLPPNFLHEHPFDNGELIIRDESLAAYPRQEEEVKRHIAEYYAMITHLDHRIGQLIQTLKDCGLYENTIIVFMADNGLGVGQHSLMGKQNIYRHSVNVPLFIKQAGTEIKGKGKQTGELCYLIDVYPTICQMAGLEIPVSVDGKSLTPILYADQSVRSSLYLGYRHFQRGIIKGEWKLIEYHVKGKRTTQLFNVREDPFEIINYSENKKYAKLIKRLRSEMVLHRDETSDKSEFWESFCF